MHQAAKIVFPSHCAALAYTMKLSRLLLALAVGFCPVHTWAGAVIREEGAIYLEDQVRKPVRLTVLNNAAIYYQADLARWLGTLRKGQLVELQAVSDSAYRVRGQAQQGQVAGWVEPRDLSPLKKEFIEGLRQNAARLEEVKSLIAKNEVAINMTPDEVRASLGKPPKRSTRIDDKGRHEAWEYIRYEMVPQQSTGFDAYGQLVATTIYVKVPVGRVAVIFDNGLVSAIEQSEGTLLKENRVKMVAQPLEIY
jgi:hypothetical protein